MVKQGSWARYNPEDMSSLITQRALLVLMTQGNVLMTITAPSPAECSECPGWLKIFTTMLPSLFFCFVFVCLFFSVQDLLIGGHSSSSSTSSLSTPTSVAHSPPQQQVNGLMGALQGAHGAMSGIVGALNGVIQSSSPHPHPSSITSTSLPISGALNNRSVREDVIQNLCDFIIQSRFDSVTMYM